MKKSDNLDRLFILAEEDPAYQVWKRTYEETASDFEAYANSQSEYIRNLLWSYAESGRLMYQRLTNLACQEMEFPESP